MHELNYGAVIMGAGPAGVCAALACGKYKIKTAIFEKNQFCGGTATAARVHSMLTFHGKKGHRIIRGIPEEIITNLKKAQGTAGHIRDTVGVAYSVTPVDPDKLAVVLQEMLMEAKVDYYPDTLFLDAHTAGRRIESIRVIAAGSPARVRASVFIDATGSGDMAASAGCSPVENSADGLMPATLIFQVRNVNLSGIVDYMLRNPGQFHRETLFRHLKESPAIGVSGFFHLWNMAELDVPRDRLLFYQTLNPDEVAINSTRITDFNPLDPLSTGQAFIEGRRQINEIAGFLKERVPGFENSRISNIAQSLGVREVRRIKGRYVLTEEDLLKGRRFKDEVALGGFPIDIHNPHNHEIDTDEVGGAGFYGIPYSCLLPVDISNLLTPGKCFSGEFRAHASARVQATSMAMGQAAGIAAGLACKKNIEPPEVEPEIIRQAVVEQGGILEPDGIEELP